MEREQDKKEMFQNVYKKTMQHDAKHRERSSRILVVEVCSIYAFVFLFADAQDLLVLTNTYL